MPRAISIDKEKARKDFWYYLKYIVNLDKAIYIPKEWQDWWESKEIKKLEDYEEIKEG